MIMMDYTSWVHCNSCGFKIDEQGPSFHITQCGHVYCSRCIEQAKKKCYQCGETGILSLPIKEPLNLQIAHYFTDPELLHERAEQAKIFQKSQMKLLAARSSETQNKYQALKQEYMSVVKDMKALHEKYNKVKMLALSMQKDNKKLISKIAAFNSIQCETPPNQVKQDLVFKTVEGFKVPVTTRVPKSIGYYSVSSNGSNLSNLSNSAISTPKSTCSNPRFFNQ